MGEKDTRFGYTAIQDINTPGEESFSGFCVWDMDYHQQQKQQQKCYEAICYRQNEEVGGEPVLLGTDKNGYDLIGTYIWNLKEHQSYFLMYRNNIINKRRGKEEEEKENRTSRASNTKDNRSSNNTTTSASNNIKVICRMKMPHRVPFGFHGEWIPGDTLRKHFDYHGK